MPTRIAADPQHFTDAAVAAAATRAVHTDRAIPGGVRVTVDHGNATIAGTVRFAQEKLEAEDVVRHVAGVRRVTNRLVVKSGVEPPDECC